MTTDPGADAIIGDLRHRLTATQRHVEHLRHRLADLEADNATLRAELREAEAIRNLLPPVDAA